jgi:hypothetical protein
MMADEPRLLDLFGQLGSAAIQDAIPAEFQTVEPVSVPERAVVIDDARPGILVRLPDRPYAGQWRIRIRQELGG